MKINKTVTFKSLTYYGGNGFGQSSVDEIRFADTYGAATPVQ